MSGRRSKKQKKQKVSEMLLKVAEGFLSIGKDIAHREDLLRTACSAWNIACLEHARRSNLIAQYIERFRQINNASEETCRGLREDIERLIDEKDRLYPNVSIQIVDSRIELVQGVEHVFVTSMSFR